MDWIKITCNILDHRKIKMIRKEPEGNTLVLLWLLMLTEAGKCQRGGYLMVSDSLPYTGETLSMTTEIPLPIVQLGLVTFARLEMIDRQDGAIFIKNWRKYQSEDKLEARREQERIRQQRCRENERSKMQALHSDTVSRDSHAPMSRDVTQENREEQSRKEQTTDRVRLLLRETPLSQVSDQDLHGLEQRHGIERLLQAADIAAETWRRNREDKQNPGGYLNALCTSLNIPDWYVPFSERLAQAKESLHRKEEIEAERIALKAQEKTLAVAKNALWDSLSDEQREEYRTKVKADLPACIEPSPSVTEITAKCLAWQETQPCGHE